LRKDQQARLILRLKRTPREEAVSYNLLQRVPYLAVIFGLVP